MSSCTFIFQAHSDGTATLTYDPDPSDGTKPARKKFKTNEPIGIKILPPVGSKEKMKSVEMYFTSQYAPGPATPFAGTIAGSSDVIWQPGEAPLRTCSTFGMWGFSAKLTSDSNKTYKLPDPEMQVGDGPPPMEDKAHGHSHSHAHAHAQQ